jgi:hypothetical protein
MYFYLIQIFIAIIKSKFDAIFIILWTHLSNYILSSNVLKIISNLHLFEGIPCGERPIELLFSSRIVGGKNAFYGEAPWQALINGSPCFDSAEYKCGGVLIHHNWVLTAAHCNCSLFGSLQVILGLHNLKTEEMVAIDSSFVESEPVIKKAKRVIEHPNYQPRTFENDLALIELDGSVQFERYIQPICLPERGDQFIDAEAYVSGWGLLSIGMFDISVIVTQYKI